MFNGKRASRENTEPPLSMSRLSPTARKPGIRDVARHAGVSHTMVSLILNGKHSGSPETRAKVMDAVAALGYELRPQGAPAAVARSRGNGSRQTGVLAFVIPKWLQQEAQHQDGYYSRTFAGVMEAADAEGYEILISPQHQDGKGLPTCILEQRVDGVLLDATFPLEWVRRITHCLPTVYLNRYYPETSAIFVTTHWPQSVRAMVRYAWEKGHRNFCFFGHEANDQHTLGTHHHFFETLRALGGELIHPELSRMRAPLPSEHEGIMEFVDEWQNSSPRPTIVLTDDRRGCLLSKELARRGFKVPDDLSVIGRVGQLNARLNDPPLTSYDYPVQEIAERAVRLLVQAIKTERLEPSHIMLEGELIERSSVKDLAVKSSLTH